MCCEVVPLCPALEFPALVLSADDMLPTDIVMLLVYRRPVDDPAAALAAGLRVFPHLTGKTVDGPPRIVPDVNGAVVMEMVASDEKLGVEDFERMPSEEMIDRFAPTGRAGG